MITVNSISISDNGKNLNINISTGVGFNITSAKLWVNDTFRDYTVAKNLDYKLAQTNNNEIFIVKPEEVGLSAFNGIFFLEFTTDQPAPDECNTCNDPLVVVVTNLDLYYRCMTEFILSSDICQANIFSKEVCDTNGINKALSVNLLIEAITQCLEIGQFVEAIDLTKNIKKLCTKCQTCNQVTNVAECSSCNSYTY